MAVLFIDLTQLLKKIFTIIRAYTANPLDLYFSIENLIDILSRLNVLFDLCFLKETFLREDVQKNR